MARLLPRGLRRIRLAAGILVLAVLLLAWISRQEPSAPLRYGPPPATPPRPPFLARSQAKSPLEGLVRRHADQDVVLEVIYANPLLPEDEGKSQTFRVVALFRGGSSPPDSLPVVLYRNAQLRTSDGGVLEGPTWQEEIRRGNRILGYLCFPPDERHPWLTPRTRWIELSLQTASGPVRLRWPITPVPRK